MDRTQIQLRPDQTKWLREVARRNRESVAEVIRRLIDEKRAAGSLPDRAARLQALRAIAGKGDSGLTDVASNHDKYLEEAYMQ